MPYIQRRLHFPDAVLHCTVAPKMPNELVSIIFGRQNPEEICHVGCESVDCTTL